MRPTLWSNLRILALALLLGFSYSGEAIAHGLAHHREQEDHQQQHSWSASEGLTDELDAPTGAHADQILAFSEGPRLRVDVLPAMVRLTLRVTFSRVAAEVVASAIDVEIHPRRGPPPRLRAPPVV